MAVSQTNNGGATQAPKAAATQDPKSESQNTPKDNKAAKEASDETKAAARNAFGNLPKNDDAKQPDKQPKTNVTAPEGAANPDPKDAAAPQDVPSPKDPDAPKDAPSPKDPDAPKDAPSPKDPDAPKAAPSPKDPDAPKTAPSPKDPDAPKAAPSPKDPDAPKAAPSPKDPAAPKDAPSPAAPDAPKAAPSPAAPDAPKDAAAPKTPEAPKDAAAAKNPDAPKDAAAPKAPTDNSNIPPPAPATDPKVGTPDNVSPVDPEVDKILNTPLANGKTIAEEANAKTMADLKKHADLLKLAGAPDDAVSKYYKLKKAEALLKMGIPTGPDPKDPTVPAIPGTEGESSTYDILDAKKIAEGIKSSENDPEVQAWLSKQQVYNQEHLLDEKIKNGEIADVPKDPNTGLRTDYLKTKQMAYLQNPDVVKALAKLPQDKQQEAIGKAVAPIVDLGGTPVQAKKELYTLIDGMAKVTGAPSPVVDANYDTVKNVNGETIVKDQKSGQAIAVGADGKVVTDPNNGMPTVYNVDGTQVVTNTNESVQLDPSGAPIVVRNGAKNVYDAKTNDLLKNPDTGNKIVIDLETNAPVEIDPKMGGPAKDSQSGLPKVVDIQTGKPLTNPSNGNTIVVDKETGAPVEVEGSTGKIVSDKEGNVVVVNPKTGYQVWDKNNNPVVMDKTTKMPFSLDPKSGAKIVMNPQTGAPLIDPKEGATILLDPETKLPVAAVTNKETGEVIKNPNGQIAQIDEATGLSVVVDTKSGEKSIVDPSNGYAVQDPKGNTLYVDKGTGLPIAKDKNGFDVTETMSGAKVIYDPKTGVPLGSKEAGTLLAIDPVSNLPVEVDYLIRGAYTKDANGNTVVMDPSTGKQKTTADGKAIVIDKKANSAVTTIDGKNIVVNPYTGEYVTDKDTGIKVMIDPDSGSPVYQDPTSGNPFKDPFSGGLQIVDPKTGAALTDVDGNAVQIDPKTGAPSVYDKESKSFKETAPLPVPVTDANGDPVTTTDGKIVAKDGGTGNSILLDPNTKQPIDGPKAGMPQIVDAKGAPVKNANGNFVVQDKVTGNPVAVDANGNTIADPKGNALVYDAAGKQVADSNGNPVVLDKASGAPIMTNKTTGEPVTDAAGNVYVANPETGGAVIDAATGDAAVLEKESSAPVVAAKDGTIYKDANGNAYMADVATGKAKTDPNGNYIMVDKSVGMPVVVDPKTGVKSMVDGFGNVMKDPKSGGTYEIGKNGLPQIVLDNGDGTKAVIDPQTGKQMEINGNKVFVDPKTGQTVMNDPLLGDIDVLTGKAPMDTINGANTPHGEFVDKFFKAFRGGSSGSYWMVYGFAGAKFSKYANNDFFKNTKNFHAARALSSVSGIATMVMAGLRWADGTPMGDKLKEGDPKTALLFAEDMSAVMKYLGFYPKTVEGIVKYLGGDAKAGKGGVQVAGDNKTLYKPNPAKGTVDIFVAKGEVNPFTGVKSKMSGWVEAPPGKFTVNEGVVSPVTSAEGQPAPGAVRPSPSDAANPGKPLQFEKWNPNTGKWDPIGTNPNALPKGITDPNYYKPEVKPTSYAKYAASKVVQLVGKIANFAMGMGNIIGGGLQIYKGAEQIAEAIKNGSAGKGISGAFNVISGAAYAVTGAAGVASALGLVGAIAGTVIGVGLAVGNVATMIAIVADAFSDPEKTKPQKEQWANKVLAELEGVDVLKPDAKQKLEEWFAQFALGYWYEKDKSAVKGEFPDTTPKGEGAKYGPKWGGGR